MFLIFPSASGWRAKPSTAWAAAEPCPIPGPIDAKPIENPAPRTEADVIKGFNVSRIIVF